MLQLFTVFHLNLAYSSIEEWQRLDVIQRCYWPLVRLARRLALPLGIEASGFTLETAAHLDPAWLDELRSLTESGRCELVGSGYAQIIGPLVPAAVNRANLRLGNETYRRLLGFVPEIALVNEQAYSPGLLRHYLDAGYRAIVMEWDNPARHHPEWDPAWRYLPQLACGHHGEQIPLIWNKSIAFQKFQRYAHGELELVEYLAYLAGHVSAGRRAFSLYGNDVEIFDFRPGRYETEPLLACDTEWGRIERFFEALGADRRFEFIPPRDVLNLTGEPGSGNRLHLESPRDPIPVKKQGKYNVTRWAVTGRNDLGINTACCRAYDALVANPQPSEDAWRDLCGLWASDFRTHITEARWAALQHRLAPQPDVWDGRDRRQAVVVSLPSDGKWSGEGIELQRDRRYLVAATGKLTLRLNCQRGLAIDELTFRDVSDQPLCGTLKHGYYDDIQWGADYYTAHVVLESAGRPKITDLSGVEPVVSVEPDAKAVYVSAQIPTPLGPIRKTLRLSACSPRLEVEWALEWREIPVGSLRLGYVTLMPSAFDRETLFYRCHNGGSLPETFQLDGTSIDHGDAVSFLVSARQAIGLTEGYVELGDARRGLRIEVDRLASSLVGMISFHPIGDRYFYRIAFSAAETDETRHPVALQQPLVCRLTLSAFSAPAAGA